MKLNSGSNYDQINFDDTSVAFAHLSNQKLRKKHAIFWLMNQNWMVNIGTFLLKLAFKLKLPIKYLVKNTLFEQFCGGESIEECQNTINNLAQFGVGTILDYSVEGEDNEEDFDATVNELVRTIETAASQPEKIPFAVFKITGIGSFDILSKYQIDKNSLSKEEEIAFKRIKDRVRFLASMAASRNVRLFFDAEESWIQNTIDELCYEMMKLHNVGERVIIYNTFQFYLKASHGSLVDATETARLGGYKVGAKLVRGAYMEKERKRAEDMGYDDPIQPDKPTTDDDFNRSMIYAIDNLDIFAICLGTHNEDSCKLCIETMQLRGIMPTDERVYFAQLLGMSDNISYGVASAGFNSAKYVPYGPVEAVMPYLLRRSEENTSVSGQSSREFLLVKNEVKRRKAR
jgi:proline dehydrogenase